MFGQGTKVRFHDVVKKFMSKTISTFDQGSTHQLGFGF